MFHKADVAVIGAGIAGTIASLALRRAGLSVALIDAAHHPKFALGESTFPAHRFWLRVLARRWNMPELEYLSTAHLVNTTVAPTSGLKHHFGFVWHGEGESAPREGWMHPIGGNIPLHGDSHWFRQDVDAFVYHQAVRSGVAAFPGTPIAKVDVSDDGVQLTAKSGDVFDAAFVIDATSFRSVLCEALGLRETPGPLRTASRCLFTHMIGVRPYDEVCGDLKKSIFPWHSGTLHHVFDGGWMWVIPFDNHEESKNPLCSVGVLFDTDRYPRPEGVSPAEEWQEFLARFPNLARQFEGATAVRSWISTGRLQYSARTTVGNRFWISPAAAFNVDALYSHGIVNVLQVTHAALGPIIEAVRANDFDVSRFAGLDALAAQLRRVNDGIVYGSYRAMKDPRVFGAFLTLWNHFTTHADLVPYRLLAAHRENDDPAALAPSYAPYPEESLAAMDECIAVAEEFSRDELSADDAIERIFASIDRHRLFEDAGLDARTVHWEMRDRVFDETFNRREKVARILGDMAPEQRQQVAGMAYELFDRMDRFVRRRSDAAAEVRELESMWLTMVEMAGSAGDATEPQ